MNTEIKLQGDITVFYLMREHDLMPKDEPVISTDINFVNSSLDQSSLPPWQQTGWLGQISYLHDDFLWHEGLDRDTGRINSVTLGTFFAARDAKGNVIESPGAYITRYSSDEWKHELKDETDIPLSFNQYMEFYLKDLERLKVLGRKDKDSTADTDFIIQEGREENELIVFNKKGELVFRVNSEVEELEGEKSLVVYQTHIPTDIVKILRAKIRINKQKIYDAIFSRPPYDKERKVGKDRLIVPWRNIDGIVGASLSYLHPRQTPQK